MRPEIQRLLCRALEECEWQRHQLGYSGMGDQLDDLHGMLCEMATLVYEDLTGFVNAEGEVVK